MTCLGVSTETDTGIQVTASESPPHPRPYCRGRVWRSFGFDLESRIFEAPFASLYFMTRFLASSVRLERLGITGHLRKLFAMQCSHMDFNTARSAQRDPPGLVLEAGGTST